MSHVLGSGAVIAGRQLEGVGETLHDAGQITDTNIDNLTIKIKDFILNPKSQQNLEKKAQIYANQYSWHNQVKRHYALSDEITNMILSVNLIPDLDEYSSQLDDEMRSYIGIR